jgi:hypothetical protein
LQPLRDAESRHWGWHAFALALQCLEGLPSGKKRSGCRARSWHFFRARAKGLNGVHITADREEQGTKDHFVLLVHVANDQISQDIQPGRDLTNADANQGF